MNSNFERSLVVTSIMGLPNGDYEFAFLSTTKTLKLKTQQVRFTTRSRLTRARTSQVLGDLGPNGFDTKEIVVSAESAYRFDTFFTWCSNVQFPGIKTVKH